MMKKLLIAGMTALSLCLCALLLAGCSIGPMYYVYEHEEKYEIGNAEMAETVCTLDIDWVRGDVKIEYDDGDTIRLSESADRELTEGTTLHYWLDGTTLRVKFAASGVYRGWDGLEKTLTVKVPEGTEFAAVIVDGGAADIKAETLFAERVKIDTASGKIDVAVLPAADGTEDAKGTEVKLNTASGAICASVCGFEEVDLDTASGAISADITRVSEINADTASGKVGLTITGECDSCDVDTASGAIRVEAEQADEISLESSSGAITLSVDKVNEVEIDTASGDVTLNLPENLGFSVRVDTASGEFEYDLPLVKQGKIYVAGDGAARIDIDTASGDVTIRKK